MRENGRERDLIKVYMAKSPQKGGYGLNTFSE